MKKLLILTFALSILNCKAQNQEVKPIVTDMLVGKAIKSDLQKEPFAAWFNPTFENYKPKATAINDLKSKIDGIQITIFMGTWCSDSQAQVPNFYKILKEIGFDDNKVKLITMTKEKTTPEKLEEGLNITNVPTFIFYKNGKELQRIVETPVVSIEEDMLKIVTQQAYKHNYE
jgi:thiol-disulfide isomerase/thioredoxin